MKTLSITLNDELYQGLLSFVKETYLLSKPTQEDVERYIEQFLYEENLATGAWSS
jgi:hypothetical protein